MVSQNKIKGARGEQIAEEYLKERGMCVVERNVRSVRAEIDIVVQDGATLRFVEVKSRMSGAEETITASLGQAKLRQLVKGAADYMAKFNIEGVEEVVFDLVVVIFEDDGSYTVEYTPSFFYPSW